MGGELGVRRVGGDGDGEGGGGELEPKGEGNRLEIMDELLEVGVVAEVELETEGSSTPGINNGDGFVPFKTGKAAFGEGSGMLKYESSKISS